MSRPADSPPRTKPGFRAAGQNPVRQRAAGRPWLQSRCCELRTPISLASSERLHPADIELEAIMSHKKDRRQALIDFIWFRFPATRVDLASLGTPGAVVL